MPPRASTRTTQAKGKGKPKPKPKPKQPGDDEEEGAAAAGPSHAEMDTDEASAPARALQAPQEQDDADELANLPGRAADHPAPAPLDPDDPKAVLNAFKTLFLHGAPCHTCHAAPITANDKFDAGATRIPLTADSKLQDFLELTTRRCKTCTRAGAAAVEICRGCGVPFGPTGAGEDDKDETRAKGECCAEARAIALFELLASLDAVYMCEHLQRPSAPAGVGVGVGAAVAAGPSKKRKRAAAPPPPPPQGTGAGTGYGSGSNYALGFGFGGGPASTSNGTGYAYDAYDHDEFYSDEDDNEFGYGLGYGYGFGSGSEDDDSDDDPVAGGGYNPADYTDEESFYEAMEAKIKEAKKANSKAAATGKAKGKGKGEAKDGAPSDKGKGKGNGKGGSKANGGTAAGQKAGTSKQQQKKKKKKAECEPDQPVEMTAKVARDAAQDRIYLAALRIATSLLPEPDSPSARMYDFLPHPTLAALLELSTLPDLLALLLRNDSVPEWQRRSDVYFAMLDLLRSFGGCEATLGLLFGPRREKRFSDGIGAWMRAARGGDGGGGEVAWAYEAGDESAAVVATAAGMGSKGKGKGKAPARGKKRKAAEAIGQEAAESQSEQQGDKGKVVLASPLYSLLKKLLIQAHAFRRAASSSNEFDDADVALLGICGDFAAAGERFVATELVWKERDRRDQRAMLMVEAAPEEAGDDQVGSKVEEAGMATRTRGRKGKDKGREERIWTEREYVKACEELAYGAVELDVKQHHYSREIAESATSRRPHGSFVHLAKELAVLSTSLPPGIWVRHDEERVDVLKCLLAGPEHSPYAGGLFEFDIFLPLRYPEVSPLCWLVTTGGNRVRFNPNLYAEGKVCLSLLGTWSGTPEEMWQPNKSTILQVLLSITSMILGTNYPFYNEPGFGAPRDDERNQIYNKNVSLATARWAILDWIDGDKYKGSIWADVIASHFLLRRSQVLATVKEWAKLDARLHAWLPQHDKCAGTHHLTPYGSLYVSPWNADGTQKTEAELEKERDKLRKADEQGKRDLVVEIERALKKLEGWKGAGTATAEWLDKLVCA